ncbi:MAG: agmatinase [Bacteroidetes bacterium]|nr:agmatinase [Bacteroidota bacterium]
MIKLLGVPFDGNSSFMKGPALAPARIRFMEETGSANEYSEDQKHIARGISYRDAGDISFTDTHPAAAYQTILQRVRHELHDGDKLLCLGGDHSVSFPIIEAHTEKYKDLHVLHLDAHADLYDDFDGNPFSHASPFARLMEKGKVKSLTQVGIRTMNPHQQQQATKFNVKVVAMKDFSMDFIHSLSGPLYISLDMDVLDPAFAPGVSHHEPGGLSSRELIRIIQSIQVPVVGADIVEYNPLRDTNNMTAMVGYKLVKELTSKMIG